MKLRSRLRRPCAALLAVLTVLPIAPAYPMMATPGAFRVTESGSAAYEIPIRIPSGSAGMVPSLALTYNSQSGNGLVGVGWSVSGLSVITRCAKSVAQDGARGGVLFNGNDRYCLDGQRLIALTPGTDGWAGSEYRTERETFAKIVAVGSAGSGPASFQVWTKSGQIIEYGNTADSRAEAQGRTDVRVYGVNKITDTIGNYLTVIYTDDQANGDHYPTRIDYTGNAGSSPTLVPNQSVRFVYEARPASDTVPLYQAGSLVKSTKRLTNIQTFVGASMVTDYRIAYEQSPQTGRSRVTTVTECPPSGSCQPATTITWTASTTAFSADASWGTRLDSINANGLGTKYYDVNGDGRGDLVYDGATGVRVMLNSGGTTFGTDTNWGVRVGSINPNALGLRLADLNRDGRMVVVYDSPANIRVMLSSGSAFGTDTAWGTRLDSYNLNDPGRLMLIDLNGDDRPDAVYDGAAGIRVLLNGGASFGTDTNWGVRAAGFATDAKGIQLADMNGDGFPDVVYVSNNAQFRVMLSNGASGFGTDTVWGARAENFNPNATGFHLADVNGDGLPDVVYDGAGTGVRVLINTGSTFAADALWGGHAGSYNSNSPGLRFTDLNADGRADVVFDANDGVRVMISTGTNFTADVIWGARADGFNLNDPTRLAVEDLGGDGRGDVVYDGGTTGNLRVLKTAGSVADLLATVSNGIGVTTTVTYQPLTDTTAGFYTMDSGSVYPIRDLRTPIYVVSSHTASNGIGGTVQFSYAYTGLKAHLEGRGLLGFRIVQVTDPLGLKNLTTTRQDWPFIGRPSQVKRTRADGGVLTQVDNTYACKDFDADPDNCTVALNKRYFPYVSQSDEITYDLNGAFMTKLRTTNTFESFGNATQVVATHLNANNTSTGYSKTTTNTYTNDVSGWNWVLGRLTQSTVTSVTP